MNSSKSSSPIRRSRATLREALIGLSGRNRFQSSREGHVTGIPAGDAESEQISEANIEYLRHMYDSMRVWYTAAETKAQLLLGINGVFITLLFTVLFSRPSDIRTGSDHFGIDTWIFITLSVTALSCAIVCAAACLWSLHGRSGAEFTRLGVNPQNPNSYRPEVLWYFGHVARLRPDAVSQRLLKVDRSSEARVLSYHVIDLSSKVLRKHRWMNLGWISTAVAVIALVAAGISFFIHYYF
jgi:hypothetical protein